MLPPCGLSRIEQQGSQPGGLLVSQGPPVFCIHLQENYPNHQLSTDQIQLLPLFHIYSRLGQWVCRSRAKGVSSHLVKPCSLTHTHTHTKIFGQKAAVYTQIRRPMFWFQLHSYSWSALGKVTALQCVSHVSICNTGITISLPVSPAGSL